MLLIDRINSNAGKFVSYFLILTTQSMVAQLVYAQDEMNNAVLQANQFSKELLDGRQLPNFNSNGELVVNGESMFTKETLTGQTENDYLPAAADGYGSDSRTLQEANKAIDKYNQGDIDSAESSGEKAYHIIRKSFESQKPDMTNDPIWENTDNIYGNLEEIAKDFSECKLETKDVQVGGNEYHVPKYKSCERLPAIEDNFTIAHDYEVGIVKYNSGPVNLNTCGDGCLRMWVGTVGNNYWPGNCTIYEESMSIQILQPKQIDYAVLERSKFDDYHQVWLNDTKIYNGPNGNFPPETEGKCELSTSWDIQPNINITNEMRGVAPETIMNFKTRTSVSGEGEGYSVVRINFNTENLIYNDVWDTNELVEKTLQIQKQADDGFCSASITCADMPTLDANGCTTINGIKACENNFKSNPLQSLGISPFCRKVKVSSTCNFNEGQFCTENLEGNTECINNDTVDRNTCKKYEDDPTCSFVKTECVEGAEGDSGSCYVQEDTYDCGFTSSTGQTAKEDVLTCDGEIQCIGESCYSPTRDQPNEDFAKANAYLEILKYANADMKCEGVPERPFDPESPPDRYTPIPSCATGYEYSKEADMCLKATQCAYSDSDFYAAGHRNGIQAVSRGAVLINDSQIPTCVPVENNGSVYTCGEAQKKVATDTFYSICQNEQGSKIPNGCPDPDHELNTTTGYCEVPPSGTCPDGYEFQEGGDPFSKLDDLCIAPPINTEGKCPTGSLLVGDQCVTEGTYNPQNTCPSGYQLSNGKCSKTDLSSVKYSCSSGYSLSGTQCVKNVTQCYYNAKNQTQYHTSMNQHEYRWNGVKVGTIGGSDTNWKTFSSGKYKRGAQKSVILVQPPYPYPQILVHEICKQIQQKTNASKSCASGYTLSGNQCKKTTTINATPVCTSGGKLSADKTKCEYSSYVAFNPTCPSGYELNDDKSLCYKDPTTVPVEDYLCPSLYPNWNEAEQRCEAKSLSPLAKVKIEPTQTNSSLETSTTKIILDEVLKPFEFMLNKFVPVAYANEQALTPNGQPTSEEMTTKKSMMNYISGQFETLAERQERDIEMVREGQTQLRASLSRSSSSATATGYSSAMASNSSSTEGGETNVTCELFKGEAAECKIAVGGMKNCCESPTAPSLGDYIKLTQTMLTMDGLTGEVFKLNDYAGVWDTASEWGSDLATSAWDSVQGAFSTGADVAVNAASETAADAATQGLMDQVAQQIMSYTNDLLIETFGPEVASMFFQTVGTGAAQEIAGSAAMQAAGAALMVVYYAYLAYVVFNLLVDIAYACEEEELDLAMKIELLSVHKIGSYCASEVLGACIEKRNVYCKFDSPLSRIIMEQVYIQPQMGLTWGTAKNPQCSGMAIDKLDLIDWDKVNLDEWTGILIETGNFTADLPADIDALTGNGSALNYTDEGRENVLERNQERFDNIDLDEVRRDAYEDAWNKNQVTPQP